MSTPVVRTQVFLTEPKDWDEWLRLLQFAARAEDICEFVNPATPKDNLPKLVKPVRPTPTSIRAMGLSPIATPTGQLTYTGSPSRIAKADLSSVEKDELEEQLDEYILETKRYIKRDEAMRKLLVRIQESVRRDFIMAYCKDLAGLTLVSVLEDSALLRLALCISLFQEPTDGLTKALSRQGHKRFVQQ